MAYYNSFIECWNAWQLLALAEPDKQTSEVIDLPKWKPPLITFDWAAPILGRYTYITAPFYPSIRITKDMVDDMNATWGTDNRSYVQFVFKNDTALRFYIIGATGGQLDMFYQFVNLKTGAVTQEAGSGIAYSYDAVFAEGQPALYLFPTLFHYKDSSDPTYNVREVWGTLYYATEWGRIRENGGQPGDPRDWIPSVVLWSEGSWASVPDWFWDGNEVTINPEYPEESDDDEGGFGTYTDVDEEIDFPDAPTISALGSGLVNIYSPDTTALQNFTRWLWSSNYESNVIKNQASPMENIICFGFVPVDFAKVSSTITVGNVNSNVVCDAAAREYIPIDCGSINVPEYFGGFLDYNADYQIYLPYIGYKPMKVDDFTHGFIHVKYWVDILTGTVQACVKCKDKEGVGKVLYSYVGNCLTELPISGANYARMKQAQMSSTVGAVSSLAGGALNLLTGNVGGAVGAVAGLINAKQTYDLARPDYEHGGGLSGNALFSIRYPYLIQTRYNARYASNYKHLIGIPAKSFHYLKDLIGYTEIESVVIDSLTHCTKDEKDAIINMLKEGVYL